MPKWKAPRRGDTKMSPLVVMLGVAAVHCRHGELAAANSRASSISQKARGCCAETRSKQSSKVKT